MLVEPRQQRRARRDSTASACARDGLVQRRRAAASSRSSDAPACARMPSASAPSAARSSGSGANAGSSAGASARCSSAVRRPSVAALARYQCSSASKNGGGGRAAVDGAGERPGSSEPADARARDPLVVPAQLVDRVLPARSLMLDEPLHDGERARLEAGPLVLQRAGQRRRPREPALGQEPADLEFRIRRRLDAGETASARSDRSTNATLLLWSPVPRTHLRCVRQLERHGLAPARRRRRPRRCRARSGSRPPLDERQQPVAGVVVVEAVDDGALARAGDAREHVRRASLQRASRPASPATQRQRHEVALGPAVGVLDRRRS